LNIRRSQIGNRLGQALGKFNFGNVIIHGMFEKAGRGIPELDRLISAGYQQLAI
jgi:hypothetical protein